MPSYFEQPSQASTRLGAKLCANWVTGDAERAL